MSIFWEIPSGCVVLSASWFDSGYMFFPVYGGFVRIPFFLRSLLGPCVRFSVFVAKSIGKNGFLGAALVSTTALV